VWLKGGVVPRSGRDSLDLFVYILQLELERFSPDDPLLDRLSKKPILPVVTDYLNVLQAGEPPLEALVSRAIASSNARHFTNPEI